MGGCFCRGCFWGSQKKTTPLLAYPYYDTYSSGYQAMIHSKKFPPTSRVWFPFHEPMFNGCARQFGEAFWEALFGWFFGEATRKRAWVIWGGAVKRPVAAIVGLTSAIPSGSVSGLDFAARAQLSNMSLTCCFVPKT